MNTLLICIIILFLLFSSFICGYYYRIKQENKIRRKVLNTFLTKVKEQREMLDFVGIEVNIEPIDIEYLKDDLRMAILEEDYEKAVKIRDRLSKLGT